MLNRYVLKFVLLALTLIAFSIPMPALAQFQFPAPIFAMVIEDVPQGMADLHNDIWQINSPTEKPIRRTTWGYNGRPIISPDGKWIAYTSVAKFAVDALKVGRFPLGVGGFIPVTIWLLAIDGSSAIRIADQPGNVRPDDLNFGISNMIIRSEPVWSPDGGKLAWFEIGDYARDAKNGKIVVYDLKTKTITTLISHIPILGGYEGSDAPNIAWSDLYFAVAVNNSAPINYWGQLVDAIFFDGAGKALPNVRARDIKYPSELQWLRDLTSVHPNKPYLVSVPSLSAIQDPAKGLTDQSVLPQVFDPQTGEPLEIKGSFAVRSTNTSTRTFWKLSQNKDVVTWTQMDATRKLEALSIQIPLINYSVVVPSPDGLGVAYQQGDNQLHIVYEGKTYSIALSGRVFAIAWGASEWIVVP